MNLSKTYLCGIFGYPISHSASPAMQNAAFKALRLQGIYLPFEISPDELQKAVESIRFLHFTGINVTIPYKEKVIEWMDELNEGARLVGAVNTIHYENGKLVGYNTDAPGFLESLKRELKFEAKGKNIFLIGAGGAARAVVWALIKSGISSMTIVDKINDKAEGLAGSFSSKCPIRAIPYDSDWQTFVKNTDLLINASPVGMKDSDDTPIDLGLLHQKMAIYDLIYNKHTKLVKTARRKNLKACSGLGMLLYQGVLAFEIWTGQKAPVGVMRKALMKHLGAKH